MTQQQFIAELAALVPPPHANLVHDAGVFANRHHLRSRIVPIPDAALRPPVQLRLFDFAGKPLRTPDRARTTAPTRSRLSHRAS
jgi:hypothetical protein